MGNKREQLVPGGYFHLYNRANAEDELFRHHWDYKRFFEVYQMYFEPFVDTYCYCLMPNHFHFLIRIKDDIELERITGLEWKLGSISKYLANEFGKGFNSYAKYYNKKYQRKGSLFIHTFNRKPVRNMEYLNILVCYIHVNPYRAGLSKDLGQWKYSSYRCYHLGKQPWISIKTKETIEWFNDMRNFTQVHHDYIKFNPEG